MAEKFRPRQISDVIGQDSLKNMIRRSLRNKTFPQFSIMYGPSGTGKSTMSEICGLSLTCSNPENGEPCCKCKSCVDNLTLLDAGKSSYNLVKINMGSIERHDFKSTIKEVFTLAPAVGDKSVYVLEEIQALTKDEQNILLEYISNMASNIYVIACTTEFTKLRQELRNRAIKFQFKQLKTDEAISLIERVCASKQIVKPSIEISKFIARSTNNCPREIVNLIDFLSDADSLNGQAITDFLGYVNNSVYIEYFNKSKSDVYEFVQWIDSISERGYINIVRGIRNFVIDCYGYIFGSNTSYFNTHEKHQIKEIFGGFDEDRILSIMKFFDECKFDDDTSAKYCLIAGRRLLIGKTVDKVFRESKREASRANIESENKTRRIENNNKKVEKITDSGLDDILSGFSRVKKTQVLLDSNILDDKEDTDCTEGSSGSDFDDSDIEGFGEDLSVNVSEYSSIEIDDVDLTLDIDLL